MGRQYEQIDGLLAAFIEKQPVFFVATAPVSAEGLVNCSPKSNRQELKVVAPDRLAYLEQTGSGIETVAHLRENGRIVVMVCAFEGPPRILRIHGKGRAHPVDSPGFARLTGAFAGSAAVGVRSIVEVDVASRFGFLRVRGTADGVPGSPRDHGSVGRPQRPRRDPQLSG
jgi:hypothetical protein